MPRGPAPRSSAPSTCSGGPSSTSSSTPRSPADRGPRSLTALARAAPSASAAYARRPMPKPIRFDRKMSEAEALMWRLDQDPVLSSTFANITVLDRPLDFERFCRRLERASNVAARLRHRVQAVPGGVAPPTWVADPDFDLRHHVQRVTVPGPARRELARLALDIAAEPFDRARPLWRFVVVDGLADGLGAVIQKLHHTLTDGEGGLRLSLEFLDVQ